MTREQKKKNLRNARRRLNRSICTKSPNARRIARAAAEVAMWHPETGPALRCACGISPVVLRAVKMVVAGKMDRVGAKRMFTDALNNFLRKNEDIRLSPSMKAIVIKSAMGTLRRVTIKKK